MWSDFREGLRYSDNVKNAVRYGYQYRKESEVPESSAIHNCILETSEILLWLRHGCSLWGTAMR